MQRISFRGANANLSAVLLGESTHPPIILLHGLRDHALGMFELLEPLSRDYYVIALDLRGHGHSDKVQTYTMIQFMADVEALYQHLKIERAILAGHSLGGHIVMRFAATFPEKVQKLILLDGMGPPGLPENQTPSEVQSRLRMAVDTVTNITGERRAIPYEAEAKRRLRSNNPLLSEALLDIIVAEGMEPHPEGGLRWRWESAVNMVWSTFSQAETESLIPLIQCPVLIVTGDRGLDYWVAMRPELDDVAFYEAELTRRQELFKQAQHLVIENAGHMLHYDQPAAVYAAMVEFLAP